MAVKVGVINVTGFAGMEAARILWDHPEARLVAATGRSLAGQKLGEAFPHLAEYGDFRIRPDIDEDVDVVLSALPTAESAAACVPFIRSGVRVIDIAADFRLDTAEAFAEWFGKDHPAPELLDEAVYGLPEINNAAIAASRLVANPGCYPEAAILAMAPAIAAGFVEPKVFVDAKSGVSGAGRGSGGGFGYANVNEDVSAYKIGVHNHQPEIAQELSKMSGSGDVAVTFVPHLVPMTRGIHATCYANLKAPVTHEAVLDVYRDFYRDAAFTRVTDTPPHTKNTVASNFCLVHPAVDDRNGTFVAVGVLDNLMKGAAGQAIENLNLMFGLSPRAGLGQLPVFP